MLSKAKKPAGYFLSLFGAIGVGMQNFMALSSLWNAAFQGAMQMLQLATVSFFGFCSTLVNFCYNIELLYAFMERVSSKPKPNLEGWQKFRYYVGSGAVIITGLCFGVLAFAFGPAGPWLILSVAAGIFVSAITLLQELEAWLQSFDSGVRTPVKQVIQEWFHTMSLSKGIGVFVAVGNVLAISVLFTMALTSFFTGLGVAFIPAIIVGAGLAFTVGAFTELYFYNRFLGEFCQNFKENLTAFLHSKFVGLGIVSVSVNALVNGGLSAAGIFAVSALFVAGGFAAAPVSILITAAAFAAVFTTAAAAILGMSFWIDNSEKIVGFFKRSPDDANTELLLDSQSDSELENDLFAPQLEETFSDEEEFGLTEPLEDWTKNKDTKTVSLGQGLRKRGSPISESKDTPLIPANDDSLEDEVEALPMLKKTQ